MPRCEYHEDYIDMHKSLKEHIDRVERGVEGKIADVDKRVEKALNETNKLENSMFESQKEHKETEIYVKELYKKMDDLTTQVRNLVVKFDTYFLEQISIKQTIKNNSDFTSSGKKMVFEVVKWIILLVLGAAIANY